MPLWLRSLESPEQLLQQAEAALAEGDYEAAERFAAWIPASDPLEPRGRLIAGEAATRSGRYQAAIAHYRAVPRDGTPSAILAAQALGELFRTFGLLTEAEQQYAYALQHDPEDVAMHERMAFVLGATGRRWESVPHLMRLLRGRVWDVTHLAVLASPETPIDQQEYLEHCAANAPQDPLVQLGLAAWAMAQAESDRALPRLKQVVAMRPDLNAAQAMLGELLVDGSPSEYARWHAELPEAAEGHPEIWYVRGLWARRQGDSQGAIRCFWESLRRAPEHRRATYQLGQVLGLQEEPGASEVSARAQALIELGKLVEDALYWKGQHEPALQEIAESMERLGRLWEAWAWAGLAAQLHPQAAWPASSIARLQSQLHEQLPLTLASANLGLRYDYSHYPLPDRPLADREGRGEPQPTNLAESMIRFHQEVGVGIDFVYENATDATTPGARMFEQNGGGVAAIDYDGDGWPDLYFSQGGDWEQGASEPTRSPEMRDVLYRNLGGSAFVEVAPQAGLENLDFGQGVAVGDFNNDGFPDLYVANVGHNRLYRNNGDGTFSDVTDESGIGGENWTSSCVIVDLNGNGLPDLFEVNYLTGPQVFELICGGRACSPVTFAGAPDRLFLNRGDGTFQEIRDVTPTVDAKGLGVVAAILDGENLPSLFIANDQVPNHLLQLRPLEGESGVELVQSALLRGLAYNGEGRPLACMGIAADDVNGNGRLDFLVTNFREEPNTLYLQDSPGSFVDATRGAGLYSASYPFVGWGTQFLDADLDGEMDLVVTNGHVDDYRDEGGLYHMPTQFFRNTGGGRFVALPDGDAGDFFAGMYAGRGLARLDWNGDGRMDFVISNIGLPAALVSNRSTGVGRYLNVRLRGTTAARDAIGSLVDITTGEGNSWRKQLTAGDGYMASNERVLQFGLGDATSVASLRIQWPSGATTSLENLPTDATVEIVEGARKALIRQGSQPADFVKSR